MFYWTDFQNSVQGLRQQGTTSDPQLLVFVVPQGSVLGPMYTTALSSVIAKFKNIKHYLYADDTQIYVAITPDNASPAFPALQECIRSVQDWMAASKFKLKPDKTRVYYFWFTFSTG